MKPKSRNEMMRHALAVSKQILGDDLTYLSLGGVDSILNNVFLDLCPIFRWAPGEPRPTEEEMHKIPPALIFADQIREALEVIDVKEHRYEITLNDTVEEGRYRGDEEEDGDHWLRLWSMKMKFPFIPARGDPETIAKCEELLESGRWNDGVSYNKRFRNSGFQIGDEVRPKASKNVKGHQWWFLTKYQTIAHMTVYRLLRSDGKLTTCPGLIPVEDLP